MHSENNLELKYPACLPVCHRGSSEAKRGPPPSPCKHTPTGVDLHLEAKRDTPTLFFGSFSQPPDIKGLRRRVNASGFAVLFVFVLFFASGNFAPSHLPGQKKSPLSTAQGVTVALHKTTETARAVKQISAAHRRGQSGGLITQPEQYVPERHHGCLMKCTHCHWWHRIWRK